MKSRKGPLTTMNRPQNGSMNSFSRTNRNTTSRTSAKKEKATTKTTLRKSWTIRSARTGIGTINSQKEAKIFISYNGTDINIGQLAKPCMKPQPSHDSHLYNLPIP